MSRPGASGPLPPIPLTVLTGFLGAGKTTLLNRLLKDPALADTVVIVNEFGAVGLDHLLVEAADDGVVLLSAGCLCCTVRGDLVATLEDLLRRRDNGRVTPFRRVVVETTGLADPAPILAAILYHPYLSRRYAIAGLVTAVDAVNGAETLARPEAHRQIAMADRIVLTKSDLLAERGGEAGPLMDALRRLNPAAPIIPVDQALADAILAADSVFGTDGKVADVAGWLRAEAVASGHHHHAHDVNRHGSRIRSFVLWSEAPVPSGALDAFLDILRATWGPKLLRIKGLVATSAEPDRPVVLHLVQHVLHVPAMLPAWPDGDRRSRLVLIVEDVPPEAVERLWAAFTGQPGIDAPDGAALRDNPLAPPTLARTG